MEVPSSPHSHSVYLPLLLTEPKPISSSAKCVRKQEMACYLCFSSLLSSSNLPPNVEHGLLLRKTSLGYFLFSFPFKYLFLLLLLLMFISFSCFCFPKVRFGHMVLLIIIIIISLILYLYYTIINTSFTMIYKRRHGGRKKWT